MGFRHRRSGRLFQDVWIKSSFGAPGTGISLRESSQGDGRILFGAAVLLALSILVLLLP